MDKTTKYQEAFKTALAVAIVYGLSLYLGWMKPYWAAFTIALIALPTAGQSFNKGIMRLAGTLPGGIVGLLILAIAPQERWLFMAITAVWVFIVTYFSTSSKNWSYFWTTLGVTTMVILSTSADTSEAMFQTATFRTLETGLGIIVYMLVSVFIWPRTNIGALRQTSSSLLGAQSELITRLTADEVTEEELDKLRTTEVQLIAKLAQDLQAEGSESYDVEKNAKHWLKFHQLCAGMMMQLDKWYLSLKRLNPDVVYLAVPHFKELINQLEAELKSAQLALSKGKLTPDFKPLNIVVTKEQLNKIGQIDRIKLLGFVAHFNKVGQLTFALRKTLNDVIEQNKPAPAKEKAASKFWISPNISRASIRGALFASTCFIASYLIWIYINPPGHQAWFMIVTALAITIAGLPQLQAKVFIMPMAITCAFGISVYVFVVPHLDSYAELGFMFLILMFINGLIFKPGIAQLAGSMGIINMISITNPQMYSFAAMANVYIFFLMGFGLVYILSFMLDSPRPEKALLRIVKRFFKSTELLINHMDHYSQKKLHRTALWRFHYHKYQLTLIPKAVIMWGMFINKKWFGETSAKDAQRLSDHLQAIMYRIHELAELNEQHGHLIGHKWRDLLRAWHIKLNIVFSNWEINMSDNEVEELKTQLRDSEARLESLIEDIMSSPNESDLEESRLYELLSGYVGLSHTAINFALVSNKLDWENWKQEILAF